MAWNTRSKWTRSKIETPRLPPRLTEFQGEFNLNLNLKLILVIFFWFADCFAVLDLFAMVIFKAQIVLSGCSFVIAASESINFHVHCTYAL